MKLTRDPNNQDNVSQRHAAHLDRMGDLSLARKAGVSEKLVRAVREASASGDPARLNEQQKGKRGQEQAKYAFKAEHLMRLEDALGRDTPYARTIIAAFHLRQNENNGRWDLRAPLELEAARKAEFAANDKFTHRVGSKLAKEAARSRTFNAVKQAALGLGEGMRRGWKGTRNALAGANMRHGQEYNSALSYIDRLQNAAQQEGQRGPAQRAELQRRLQLGEELRAATTSPDRRRLVKELLRQSKKKPANKQETGRSRHDRTTEPNNKPLAFGAHKVTGAVTKQRASYAGITQELSLAAKAGVSRKLVRTLTGLFDANAANGNALGNTIARLNNYNRVNSKFEFKAEQLWRVQNFLRTRNQNDASVRLLTSAIDGALELRVKQTGSEQARGQSQTHLREHFLKNSISSVGLDKIGREIGSLPLTHRLEHAAISTGEYIRRGAKSTKNWTGGGRDARHDGQFGHVHSTLEARLARATDPAERDRVQAELASMGTRSEPNRQVVRELYSKYRTEKRALAQEANEAKAAHRAQGRTTASRQQQAAPSPIAGSEAERQAQLAARQAARTQRDEQTQRALDPAYAQFTQSFNELPTLDPVVTEAEWAAEQRDWDPPHREAVAGEVLDWLLRSPTANGRPLIANEAEPFNPAYVRPFARAATPLLQKGVSLARVAGYMGREGRPHFSVQNATDLLATALHQQIDLNLIGPNPTAFEAFENIAASNRYLNDDDTIAFPSDWTLEPDNGLIHIPGYGALKMADNGESFIVRDEQEFQIPPQGIFIEGSQWTVTAQGHLQTPDGWQVRMPEEELFSPRGEHALDTLGNWKAAWEAYVDSSLANPPSLLERDLGDLLSELSKTLGAHQAARALENIFVAPDYTEGFPGVVQQAKNASVVAAFVKAHEMNRNYYDVEDDASDTGSARSSGDVAATPSPHPWDEPMADIIRSFSGREQFPDVMSEAYGDVESDNEEEASVSYAPMAQAPAFTKDNVKQVTSHFSFATTEDDSSDAEERTVEDLASVRSAPSNVRGAHHMASDSGSESIDLNDASYWLPPEPILPPHREETITPVAPLNIRKALEYAAAPGFLRATDQHSPVSPISPPGSSTLGDSDDNASISSIGDELGIQTQATSYSSVNNAARVSPTSSARASSARPAGVQAALDRYVANIRKHDDEFDLGGFDAGVVEVHTAAIVLGRNINVRIADNAREANETPASRANARISTMHTSPRDETLADIEVGYMPGHFVAAVPNGKGGFEMRNLGAGEGADCFYLSAAYGYGYRGPALQTAADELRERVADTLEEILASDTEQSRFFVEDILANGVSHPNNRPAMNALREALGPYALMSNEDVLNIETAARSGFSSDELMHAYENTLRFFLDPSERRLNQGNSQLEEQLQLVHLPHYELTADPRAQLDFLATARRIWLNVVNYGSVKAPRSLSLSSFGSSD